MTQITCTRSVSSLIFAHLLKDMLGLHDSAIIWKDCAHSNAKNSIAIDSYTHEALLVEFERRYGQVEWFHDHSSSLEGIKSSFQELLDQQDLPAESYSKSIHCILKNTLHLLEKNLPKRQRASSSFNLLTSPFVKAGWAQ